MGVDGKKDHVPVPMDKLAMAKQMAAKLTAKTATINKREVRPHKKSTHSHLYEPMMVEDGGIFQKYEEELEINDFPQQARFVRIRIQVETDSKVHT